MSLHPSFVVIFGVLAVCLLFANDHGSPLVLLFSLDKGSFIGEQGCVVAVEVREQTTPVILEIVVDGVVVEL